MAIKKPLAAEPPDSIQMMGSDFPKHSLRIALRVATALEEKNGGNPLPPTDVAIAINKSPGSSDFRVLLSSSIKYGLTTGSYNQAKVSLTTLAREVLEPTSEEARNKALSQAAFMPPIFAKILYAYKGKKVPDPQFFQNALVRDFGVSREQAERCASIFQDNAEYLGLIRQASTGKWLAAEPVGVATTEDRANQTNTDGPMSTHSTLRSAPEETGAEAGGGSTPSASRPSPAVGDPRAKRVFITHGKNRGFIDPARKLLSFGELEAVIASEKQTVAQPVPEKVMEDMRSCGAALIHVDDERRLFDPEANEHIVLNENVLIEIGAAMALYGRRFILVVKEGVKLPSNLQGLYEVRYSGDTLDGAATIKLLEAINDMKKRPLPESGPR
jgi:Predicted nucleotide-binding protein containing TIR-like domain